MVTKYDKAITAGLAPAVATIIFYALGQYGVALSAEVQAAVITILTAALVYFVPNKV